MSEHHPIAERSALVLLSGGLDSTVALFWACREFEHVEALTFDYGQRNSREISCAYDVWDKSKSTKHHVLRIPDAFGRSSSPIVQMQSPIGRHMSAASIPDRHDGCSIAGRLLTFVGLAASYMEAMPTLNLVIGQTERRGNRETHDAAVSSLSMALKYAYNGGAMLRSPLLHRSRRDVIQVAADVGVLEHLHLTHSCHYNDPKPCGHCRPCLYRRKAFIDAGQVDPLEELHGLQRAGTGGF